MNYYATELIGFDVKILKSCNPLHCGLEGKIVDETKNMVYIEISDRILKIPKKGTVYKIDNYLIDGTKLMLRPYERISKFVKMEDC